MDEHVYKIIQLAGTSQTSIEDAIQTAISKAGKSLHHLRWFEVKQIRGHITEGEVGHFQVVMKVGFAVEED